MSDQGYTPIDILLVEDNSADVRLTREAMKETGQDHKLWVVRNGEEVHTQPGSGRLLDFAWRDEQPLEGSACYYVRLVQADGHMAWPSPVWVDT